MKFIAITLLGLFAVMGLSSFQDSAPAPKAKISFYVRGNGKTNVSLGVGYQVGSGSCCRGVSKDSKVGFQGDIGDVLYDSETRRVITKVYAGLEGETIDLRQYY
jgi:hypothetical protein